MIIYNNKKYTPDIIYHKTLGENDIFVFGSNLGGRHGKGAAKDAIMYHDAKYGQAKGRQCFSYAIVTKDLTKDIHPSVSLESIKLQIIDLFIYAEYYSELTFWLVKIGTSLAGFSVAEIASIFADMTIPQNVILPKEFAELNN